ncbi:MAG: M17 family peptidase N-terminal domain-containing protein, partial [Bryobacteraceae bacterium]
METTLVSQSLDRVEADAVVVLLFEEETAPAELRSLSAWIDELRASGEFTGKTGELAVQHMPQGFKAKRLAVAGGGKRQKFDAAVLRRAVGTAVRALKQKGVKRLAWFLGDANTEAAVEGA